MDNLEKISDDGLGKNNSLSSVSEKQQLSIWIQNWLARALKITTEQLDEQCSFADLGLDSVTSVELVFDLEKHLKCTLEETLLWSYPTIGDLVEHLLSDCIKAEAAQTL